MNGTIIENLSNRKLIILLISLFSIQLICFYIGAFIAPAPSSYEQFTAHRCLKEDRSHLAIQRSYTKNMENHVTKNCHSIYGDHENTTFVVQLPFPRDKIVLNYSRWMQSLLLIISVEFNYEPMLMGNNGAKQSVEAELELHMDVDLGVMNRGDTDWKLYARKEGLKRTTYCHGDHLQSGHKIDCDLVQMFELQSLHYNYYLINLQLREDLMANQSNQVGKLAEITGVAIHQNGGFTQIWLALKTVFFTTIFSTLVWYYRRLTRIHRDTTLIERILLGLGTVLTILNAPIEFLSLTYDLPFMLFVNDLRQGVFYCVLLSFWIIFVGEHLLDGTRKNNRLSSYYKELLVICIASTSLLLFDLCDRGVQAFDPFVTIWETDPRFAKTFILTASVASLTYLGFLAYYIYLAYRTISNKQTSLPAMPLTRRLMYQGVIYRFKFLLSATLICAFSTFLFYVFTQKSQIDDERYGESSIEWTSAMFITVYAMWNLYVMVLLIFYAPSHKGLDGDSSSSEQIEFDCLTDDREDELSFGGGNMKLLQDLTSKATLD